MISIHRRMILSSICNRYFVKNDVTTNQSYTLTGFAHALINIKGTQPLQTIYIDLLKSEETLFIEIDKENRRQIRKAEKQRMQYVVLEQPNTSELKEFQSFYNQHAKLKQTYRCNSFHLRTMQKLVEKNGLVVTYITDSGHNNIYCYRIYVTDGEMAMTLYSASNVHLKTLPETRRQLSEANRYLIWKNILRFKKKGVKILDMGGLTDKPSIKKFKTGFGGDVVTVYSGYTANSIIGKLTLLARNRIHMKSGKKLAK
ncbi:hypothetical protein SLU01_15740 [Sporosarcina luteola]|uniref:Lipid II:glycine glycyltransferase n=1 Tax=Sporosarcina luteola TaxID=582850 RepID=A0A511Z734_9BACL|nr:hypothetical protein [Sporosarcina luteola]GEN83262.1 hypothetical protein SLU01_15740 [Sporosarcina luteola]